MPCIPLEVDEPRRTPACTATLLASGHCPACLALSFPFFCLSFPFLPSPFLESSPTIPRQTLPRPFAFLTPFSYSSASIVSTALLLKIERIPSILSLYPQVIGSLITRIIRDDAQLLQVRIIPENVCIRSKASYRFDLLINIFATLFVRKYLPP